MILAMMMMMMMMSSVRKNVKVYWFSVYISDAFNRDMLLLYQVQTFK